MNEDSKLFYQYYKLIDLIYLIPAASGLRLPSLGRHWHWQSYGVWRKCSSNGHQWTSRRLNRLTSAWIEYPVVSLIFPVSDAPDTTTVFKLCSKWWLWLCTGSSRYQYNIILLVIFYSDTLFL